MRGFIARSDILSWGRIPRTITRWARPTFMDELGPLAIEAADGPNGLLASGLRRSYGDSCLNDKGSTIDTTGLDHFIEFDRTTGIVKAEAGVSLATILDVAIPAGFFLPVTPGTKFVTLGGAVANDVHGKNHHRAGTIGRWVRKLVLLRSGGERLTIGPEDMTGLFAATVGGLGLTGIITHVELQLIPIVSSDMEVETIPFSNLSDFIRIAAESESSHDYTVAWIDCLGAGKSLGRGIFTRARHAVVGELLVHRQMGPTVPLDAPGFLLNRMSLSAFNAVYVRIAGRPRRATMSYHSFFYPLDAVRQWNRLYGRRGFYQYQSVVPPAQAEDATRRMLQTIAESGQGSFLAVLKTMGDKTSPGLLSFPMKGITLALDFANRGCSTLRLLDKLDAIVREAEGRLYPAKDGRLPPTMFRAGHPNLSKFQQHVDPAMSSTFWRRMIA